MSYNDSVKWQVSGEHIHHRTSPRVMVNVNASTKPFFKCQERCPVKGSVAGNQPFLPYYIV
ncbi:hypothetical protein DPMN_061896 [Dreissena polymorpha]|uniref:Uncharacterized protein n=1 Tax=Dreissena polymorpha TaxID=45954 RepID=A0A9D4C7U7_DREPO|nr:hypothetical protein DPMN_061896 [Dreissena polymorpha]